MQGCSQWALAWVLRCVRQGRLGGALCEKPEQEWKPQCQGCWAPGSQKVKAWACRGGGGNPTLYRTGRSQGPSWKRILKRQNLRGEEDSGRGMGAGHAGRSLRGAVAGWGRSVLVRTCMGLWLGGARLMGPRVGWCMPLWRQVWHGEWGLGFRVWGGQVCGELG